MTKEGCVIMPRELTVENGAKALLVGYFKEEVILQCSNCDGEGIFEDGGTCLECLGCGDCTMSVPVSWSTIKDIYKKAVKHLEIKCNHRFMYFGDQKKRRCADCNVVED